MSETRSEKEYGPPLLFTIEAVLVTIQIENTQPYIFLCNKGYKSRNSLIYTLVCGERWILYHSTIFCNSLIFKCRL